MLLAVAVAGIACHASGPLIPEVGVSGMGSAGAYVARAEDNSALFHNPAGLAKLTKGELTFSMQFAAQRSTYANIGQTTWYSDKSAEAFPSIIVNKTFGRFGLAAGRTPTSFYELEWKSPTYPGRFGATGSKFEAETISLGGSFAITKQWAVGVAWRSNDLDVQYQRAWNRAVDDGFGDLAFYEVNETRSMSGNGDQFVLGIQYYRGRKFSAGLSFESGVDVDVDGARSFSLSPGFDADRRFTTDFAAMFEDGDARTRVWLPQRINVGAAFRTTIRTRVEVNLGREDWSDWVSSDYELTGAPSGQESITREFDEITTFRVSGDFQQRKALLWRLGLASRNSVVSTQNLEPSFPDADQFLIAGGVSYSRGDWVFEAAYMYVQYRDRKVRNLEFIPVDTPPDYVSPTGENGVFETQRHHLNLGVRWRFD